MNKKLKQYLRQALQSILFWVLAMVLFGFFRFYGLESQEGVIVTEEFKRANQFSAIFPLFVLTGFSFGIIVSFIEFTFEKFISKKLPIGF